MNTEINQYQPAADIFSEEEIVFQADDATTGQRCLNLIIDVLLMRFGVSYLSGYLVGYTLSYLSPELLFKIFYTTGLTHYVAIYLIGAFNFLLYFTFCEKVFKGITLGKLLTGTKAIREDGTELTFKDALLRSLVRIVPFEVFSGFGGYPWHDTWTKTKVIKTR